MKNFLLTTILLFTICSSPALAQSTPTPSAALSISSMATTVQNSATITTDSFLGQVMDVLTQWSGGIPLGLKIACVVLLIIASMKVSFLNQLIWSKLGKFQAIAAPVLGLILGLTILGTGGPVTMPVLLAYLASGSGALALHEILDMIKGIPGIGSAYVTIINLIEGALGGKSS